MEKSEELQIATSGKNMDIHRMELLPVVCLSVYKEIIKEMDKRVSIHDFRVVGGRDHKNLIFDMVIPYEYDKEKQNDLREEFARRLREKNDRYHAVITMERSYVASAAE